MKSVTYARPARSDLREILKFIARDSRRNGERFLTRIEAKCQRLADAPELGNPVPEITGACYWLVQRYVIVFRRTESGVEVLRVLHSARDWLAEFGNSPE
ncbi:MAG: type II toxin-antitoxin system RelE/ParE family toxin [Planctomycetaceae bacterium]|nr:type II toxin-antitoxin system RelE/ParE family toxin [Planctomycetaceae bacterium]